MIGTRDVKFTSALKRQIPNSDKSMAGLNAVFNIQIATIDNNNKALLILKQK